MLVGTKASSIDSFLNYSYGIGNSSLWALDVSTGIVSFVTENFNFSMVDWPSPASGSSRSDNPPAGNLSLVAEGPIPCPSGHYCRPGVTFNVSQPKNFSTPQKCFDGYFCSRGSMTPEGVGACPSGYFCPTPLDALICPAGSYCPGVGNTGSSSVHPLFLISATFFCLITSFFNTTLFLFSLICLFKYFLIWYSLAPIDCYPGTFASTNGSSNCLVCPTGFVCPGYGRTFPALCPKGFVCSELGLPSPMDRCPSGYYCMEGTSTIDPSDPVGTRPIPCAPGVFCLRGVSKPLAIDWIPTQPWGSMHAQTCQEGTYCLVSLIMSSHRLFSNI